MRTSSNHTKIFFIQEIRTVADRRKKAYLMSTDQNGYILTYYNSEVSSKLNSDQTVRLLFVGGSTTETLFMSEESRFPARVATLLNRSRTNHSKSLNAARRGN